MRLSRKVARKGHPVRGLLLDSRPAGLEVRVRPPLTVVGVARQTCRRGLLLYLVNLDTDAPAEATVTILPVVNDRPVPLVAAQELFSGREVV